jgi:hypothetical protein
VAPGNYLTIGCVEIDEEAIKSAWRLALILERRTLVPE